MFLCYYLVMKSLKDYEKDLNKCSKCGLCESVCPLYKLTPNDCVASKGKFIMLHGVTKGDLKLSKNINKYLDTCLKCGKCNDYCPSNIDVCSIINTAKYEYMNKKFIGKLINFLESRLIFNTIIRLGKFISTPFRPKKFYSDKLTKVIYFKGCVNQICPRNDKYINKIFKNKIEIIEPDFECCGMPFLSDGNLKRFEQAAKYNTKKLFENDCDYIVTDCASCEYTLLNYPKYLDSCRKIQENKFVNWGDIIAAKGLKFRFNKPIKVTFHKPCHLKNDSFFEHIIENCENVEYIKMDNYDDCCGFAGNFSIKKPLLSKKLSEQKALNIINTNADYVITSCPACLLGLKQGMFYTNGKIKVISLLEFLAKAEVI